MGEISELIISGVLCKKCGVYIGEPVHYPRLCSYCAPKKKKRKNKKSQLLTFLG